MPIRIICEKRHHLGQEDINYPAIFCDLCAVRIDNAAEAGYYWNPKEAEDCYQEKSSVYFLHHDCSRRIRSTFNKTHQHFAVRTPFGILNSKDVESYWLNLPSFLPYLGRNMTNHCQSDLDHSMEINENTYPPDGKGWVYFLVDSGSIERKVKIGFSKNVYFRMKDLQTGCATILKCYGAIHGIEEDENLAHELLKEFNSHGEWFVFHKVVDVIDEWIETGKIFTKE